MFLGDIEREQWHEIGNKHPGPSFNLQSSKHFKILKKKIRLVIFFHKFY